MQNCYLNSADDFTGIPKTIKTLRMAHNTILSLKEVEFHEGWHQGSKDILLFFGIGWFLIIDIYNSNPPPSYIAKNQPELSTHTHPSLHKSRTPGLIELDIASNDMEFMPPRLPTTLKSFDGSNNDYRGM